MSRATYFPIEQHALKNVSHCLNTNIYSYLETSACQSSHLYLNVVHFSTPVLIRHLWQLKTVAFLHWRLKLALLLLPWLRHLMANIAYEKLVLTL